MKTGGEGSWGKGGVWFCGEVKLCIIGVAVKIDSKMTENIAKRLNIDDKKQWPQHRSLRNTMGDCGSCGCDFISLDELFSVV